MTIPKMETCAHTAPVFGCRGCVNRDKLGILEAAKREPGPLCPECGHRMEAYEADPVTMTIDYACTASGWSYDGERRCSGEAIVEVKR